MAKTSLIFSFLLCFFSSIRVSASVECTVDGKVVHRSTKAPYPFITLFVTQGKQIISWKPCKTDKYGNFVLEFNSGMGDESSAKDKSQWLYFYAVRSKGDTVLLTSFFDFPKSFRFIEDQHFRTTFYLK